MKKAAKGLFITSAAYSTHKLVVKFRILPFRNKKFKRYFLTITTLTNYDIIHYQTYVAIVN
jgi:hypothetical protein